MILGPQGRSLPMCRNRATWLTSHRRQRPRMLCRRPTMCLQPVRTARHRSRPRAMCPLQTRTVRHLHRRSNAATESASLTWKTASIVPWTAPVGRRGRPATTTPDCALCNAATTSVRRTWKIVSSAPEIARATVEQAATIRATVSRWHSRERFWCTGREDPVQRVFFGRDNGDPMLPQQAAARTWPRIGREPRWT